MANKKRIAKKIIIGVSIGLIAFVTPFLLMFSISAIESRVKSSCLIFYRDSYVGLKKTPMVGFVEKININDYNYAKIESELGETLLFPKTIINGDISMVFFSDYLFSNRAFKRGQVFLEWSTNKDTFDSEMNRIRSVISKEGKKAIKSLDLFESFTSYITCYNHNGDFEYALIDEKKFIIRYILFKDIETLDNLLFSHDYEPKRLLKDSDIKNYSNRYGAYDVYSSS